LDPDEGKFIHIRYFAVRDEDGAYRATIEVTQGYYELRNWKEKNGCWMIDRSLEES
jgi:DUF438 domain-containing protein